MEHVESIFLENIKDKKIDPKMLELDRIKVESVDDIHKGAGRILQASQEWEMEFKELCRLLKVELNDDVGLVSKSSIRVSKSEYFFNKSS